jgi:hypothetical protein
MKNNVLMRSINTLYFRHNNSLILKLTSGQRKTLFLCNLFFIALLTILILCIIYMNLKFI